MKRRVKRVLSAETVTEANWPAASGAEAGRCGLFADLRAGAFTAPENESPRFAGAFLSGRYWARTSDPQLVELVLSQLS